jgi:mono/diheme cytochrome c family protein
MDAIPGNVNYLRFEAPQPGTYKGQCAEFCGVQHALMLAQVRSVPPPEFDAWVSAQLRGGQDLGRQTYEGACAPCHGLNGQGLIGPPLAGSAVAADPQRVRTIVTQGGRVMPAVGQGWNEQQLRALVEFVQEEFASGG